MTPKIHKKIGIEAGLKLLRNAFPSENMAYFLLGNWFTDVSQGIAPVDYAASMTMARNEGVDGAKEDSWFLKYLVPDVITHAIANKLVRDLLGNPPPINSAMSRWFRNVVYVVGWIEFCYEKGPSKHLVDQGAGPIPFEEYDRIFHGKKVGSDQVEGRYTQYYPHEHLDRWPMDRTEKSPRKVYKYLEDHLLNIAEILTLVERDLVKFMKAEGAGAEKKRHEILAEFGYALHTAEDYWAHTNFVDFAMRDINDIPTDERLKRIHEKRLKRDIEDKNDKNMPRTEMFAEPGPTEDETHVVGGYFDGIDTRFSLSQIYKGLMKTLEKRTRRKLDIWNCGARGCPGHRRKDHVCPVGVWKCQRSKPPCPGHDKKEHNCGDESRHTWTCGSSSCPGHSSEEHNCKTGVWKCHRIDPACPGHSKPEHSCKEQPLDYLDWREAKSKDEREKYTTTVKAQQENMNMPQKVRDAEFAFIKEDWRMIDNILYSGKCVSWVLEKMLREGKAYAAMQFKNGEFYGERVGSHTLIAKDDETKNPGFDHAFKLATFVDEHIVSTLLRSAEAKSEFQGATGENKQCKMKDYVDWLELLKHFMGHPDEAVPFTQITGQGRNKKSTETNWWKSIMLEGKPEHKHKLKFVTVAEMNKRAKLDTRKRLEKEHNSLIRIENAKYEKEFNAGDGVATEPKEPVVLVKKGETKQYQHDDMDHGSVRLRCLEGEVQIDLSAAVWSTFEHISTAKVTQGNIWDGDFKEMSSVWDQDNRAVITALSDGAKFQIQMVSYDR